MSETAAPLRADHGHDYGHHVRGAECRSAPLVYRAGWGWWPEYGEDDYPVRLLWGQRAWRVQDQHQWESVAPCYARCRYCGSVLKVGGRPTE